MRMDLLKADLKNCITALECHIIDREEDLIHRNAGDEEWNKLNDYRSTLNNIKLLQAIYGQN